MDTMKTIEHKGRNIVLLDFVNADTAAVLRKIEEYKEIIAWQNVRSLLVLTDVTRCEINKKTVQAFKDFTAHNRPYVTASATIGLSGSARIFVNIINQFSKRDIRHFSDPNSAKDWLVTHS